ncbi:MAG: O-antigen ligase family protein [Gemmatimonadota bacterium]|nr:O-antigen ligase family protein [Gemmatimonadota bacterium]
MVAFAALPYKSFDLDRYFVPKELVLHLSALGAGLLCLSRARTVTVQRVDIFLALYLLLGAIASLFAQNWWLAERAMTVSISGAVCFWCARTVGRAGYARPLVAAIALATVVAAATSLLQTYGLESEYFSINRAPGGTLGNRNFVAHLAAIGLPILMLRTLDARRAAGVAMGGLGLAVLAAVLFLTRSRNAWLALAVGGALVLFGVLVTRGLWRDALAGRRLRLLAVMSVGGVAAALALPNTLEWKSGSPYLDSVRGVVNYREGSGHGRVLQYRNSIKLAEAHPLLGVGPGNWPVHYPRVAARNDPSLDHDSGMTANPWPSSDWIAVLSERGMPASLLLLLAMISLGVSAGRQWRSAQSPSDRLVALALAATLVVILIVGAFDAVLLLGAPALIGWSALGVLSSGSEPRRPLVGQGEMRGWAIALLLLTGSIAVARSAGQIQAMATYSSATRLGTLVTAARFDPGSYRIRMRLAESYARRGDCEGVRDQAGAAHRLFPSAPAPRWQLEACGLRVRDR